MIAPSSPEARSPGPRGPDRFSPTGGSDRRAARTSVDIWVSCPRTSSSRPCCRSGAARLAAWTAYAAAPRACAPIWHTATLGRRLESRPTRREPSPHQLRRHRRTGGGSPLQCPAVRERTPGPGRSQHEDGHHREPRPRTAPTPARHSQQPKRRQDDGSPHSASGEISQLDLPCPSMLELEPQWIAGLGSDQGRRRTHRLASRVADERQAARPAAHLAVGAQHGMLPAIPSKLAVPDAMAERKPAQWRWR